MDRKKIRMGKIVGLSVVLMSFFLAFHSASAQTAEDYFQQGKAYLEDQSLSAAHNSFQLALNLDPNHQGANLFYGLTRLLMIANSADFNTLLNRAGVASSGRDVFNWTADFTRDPQGKVLLPPGSPTGGELQSFVKNIVFPEIDGALTNLSKVGSAYETTYQWALETGSGSVISPNTITITGSTVFWASNEWAGYKIAVGGTEYTITSNTFNTITVTPNWAVPPGNYNYKIVDPVEIDYGDVLVVQGSLYLAKAGIYVLSSYNVDVNIETIVSLYNSGSLNVQNHIVNTYNQLLILLPDQQLSQAKSLMRDAINTFTSAINFIKAETDPQDNDLFVIDDPVKEQQYRDFLTDLSGTLDGTGYVRSIGYQLNLTEFFDRPKTLRNYLPHFIKTFIEAGTYPDPTLGGILPSMTSNELDKLLWNILIYPEGLLWRSVSPPAVSSNWSLSGVHFTSSKEGWAVGQGSGAGGMTGVLLHYSNGTWTSVLPPTVSPSWSLAGVHFTSSNEGWAVGQGSSTGVLLHYASGNWASVPPPAVASPWWNLTGVHFISSNEGWAVGQGSGAGGMTGVLLHYSNGNWTSVPPPAVSSSWSLTGVHLTSSNEGWAVGWDNSTNMRGVLLHYSNGAWTSVPPPAVASPFWILAGVHFTSSNEGWAVGQGPTGVLLHYSNGAWTSVTPSDNPDIPSLMSVYFTSPNEGWAVGPKDLFLHYYNGSWRSVRVRGLTTSFLQLMSVHFTSPDEGWAVGADWLNGRGALVRFSPVISRTACDFDGDNKTDIAIYRASTGVWWVIPSSGSPAYGYGWGGPGFKPVPGDYDGDGKTDLAIYDIAGGAWWIIPSSGTGPQGQVGAYGIGWGGSGFKPVRGDYDGDGKTDIAIYDTTGGAWWIIPSSGTGPQGQVGAYGVGWGGSAFKPVPGDYDGDGRTDIAIYDTAVGAWWIIPSSGIPAYGVGWGGSSFKPVPGDYDGDGKIDIAIYNTANGGWWIIPSSGTGPQGQVGAYGVGWGGPGFSPVPGDYDGDGKADVAIYQSGNGGWWIIYSSDGSTHGMGWGGDASDVPLTSNPD